MHRPRKVLVIEDTALIRESLCDYLNASGFEARGCEDGRAALNAAAEEEFQVIISDYNLPAMNGADVTQHLRERLPASIIIGVSSDEVKEEFLSSGADAFLLKPYRYRELLKLINVKYRTSA